MLLAHQVFAVTPTPFETFKGLKGKWHIEAAEKTLPIEMTYDEGSKGSIVTEQFGKELSVIFRDGEDLRMNHYCNRGNQPNLKLKKPTQPNQLEFETVTVSNLKTPDSDHVKKIIYRFISDKRIDLELVWKTGHGEKSEKYSLTKI